MESKRSKLKRINEQVVWGPKGFTNGEAIFSIRDVNYSLRDFAGAHGFHIKPAFVLCSDITSDTTSDEGADTGKSSDEGTDTGKSSDEGADTGKSSDERVDTPENSISVASEDEAADSNAQSDMIKVIIKRDEICSICQKVFPTKVHLISHRNRVHSGLKFPCGKCDKIYTRCDSLSRHLDSHR
jgi:hypothetical protein